MSRTGKYAALAAGLIAVFVTGAIPAQSSGGGRSGVSVQLLHPTGVTATRRPAESPLLRRLLVRDPAAYERQKAAANRQYAGWLARHGGPAPSTAPVKGTAVFNGLNAAGINDADGTPPDTTGAVGPSNYVELVNSQVAVYSKTSLAAPQQTLGLSAFVGDPSAFTCDPQISWDEQGQRWLYAALDCGASSGSEAFYFGWSTTPSPDLAGSWCQYIANTGHSFEDYPKLGHDNSQIIIGTNAFNDLSSSFTGSNIWVFDKPAAGVTTCPLASTLGSTAVKISAGADFTPVPADIVDSSTNGYVAAETDFSHLDLYTIGHDGAGANALLSTTSVAVPTFAQPADIPQPTTNQLIDSSDTRLTQAVAVTDPATGHEGVWTQHTVLGPAGGPDVVAWYELTAGSTTPTQKGTVSGPNNTFAFNGAISPTKDGAGAAIFYNTGSSTQVPDLRVQDRRSGTPSGTTIEDLQLATSVAPDIDFSCPIWTQSSRPCRWGDYAGATPDPSNGCLVWGTGELTSFAVDPNAGASQWGTQNAAVDICAAGLTVTRSGTGSGSVTSSPSGINCGSACSFSFGNGTSVTLAATPSAGSGFTGWTGACSGKGSCHLTMTSAQAVGATFSKCVVPKVTGKTLAAAKSAISAAFCHTGKVTNESSVKVKKGHVISQSPAAGKTEPYGTPVRLAVSTGK